MPSNFSAVALLILKNWQGFAWGAKQWEPYTCGYASHRPCGEGMQYFQVGFARSAGNRVVVGPLQPPPWQAPSARLMRSEEVITEVANYHPHKKGDFSEYHDTRPKTILYPLIANQVEFLPLNSQDGEYWLLNLLAIAHFDSERSVLGYREDGSIRGGKHFVFAQQELLGKHIFRIPGFMLLKSFEN